MDVQFKLFLFFISKTSMREHHFVKDIFRAPFLAYSESYTCHIRKISLLLMIPKISFSYSNMINVYVSSPSSLLQM